jgi:heterogeneous nuclear ribonucleoprotein K
LEVKALVHQSHAGAIIGRGGSQIKELREQTEAHLKVFSETCPMSTDRILLITTTQEKMPNVIKTIYDFLREVPLKGACRPYDATNYDPR